MLGVLFSVMLLNGEAPAGPWTLMAGVERNGFTVWLSAPMRSEAECRESMMTVAMSQRRGNVVDLYCVRASPVA